MEASRAQPGNGAKYTEALQKSGVGGIFMDELATHRTMNSSRVEWFDPDKAEGLAYLKQVQSKANGQPLAFRKGGAKALGVRKPFDKNVPDTGSWRIRGIPVQWYEEDLVSALQAAGFTQVAVLSKGHSRRPWLVRLRKAEQIRESIHMERAQRS